jgi:hypothetical protein
MMSRRVAKEATCHIDSTSIRCTTVESDAPPTVRSSDRERTHWVVYRPLYEISPAGRAARRRGRGEGATVCGAGRLAS